MITFSCKNCGKKLHVAEEHAGKRIKCPECGSVGVVSSGSDKIVFQCRNCGQSISVRQVYAGKKGKCPKCTNPVVIPNNKRGQIERMPSISITCSACARSMQVPASSVGQTIQCVGCGGYLKVSPRGVSTLAEKADGSASLSPDEDMHQEKAEATDRHTSASRRLILAVSGIAVVALAGLIVLITVILPSGSTSSGNPQGQRERQPAVDVDREPPAITPTRESPRPSVTSHAQKKALPIVDAKAKNTKIAFQSTRDGATLSRAVVSEKLISSVTKGIVSPDGQRVAYLTDFDDKYQCVIDGREQKKYDYIYSLVLSPNSKRVAYAARQGNEVFAVIDGIEQRQYGYVIEKEPGIVFSPNSNRLAYVCSVRISSIRKKRFAVVDGVQHKQYDSIRADSLVFSPDSKRMAYVAKEGNEFVLVADGREQGKYYSIEAGPVFSQDGQRLAYTAKRRGNGYYAIVDGREGKDYYSIVGVPIFSPDSKHLAYAVREYRSPRDKKTFLVVDGKEHTRYDSISEGSLTFSHDSTRFAYVAHGLRLKFVVLDGNPQKEYRAISSLTFSPDSKRLAYLTSGYSRSVVVDEQQGKKYNGVREDSIIFSPDSKRVAYVVVEGSGDTRKFFVVIDGREQKKYDGIIADTLTFSQDSRRLAYGAIMGSRDDHEAFVVVNSTEGKRYDDIIARGRRTITFKSPDSLHYLVRQEDNLCFVEEKLD